MRPIGIVAWGWLAIGALGAFVASGACGADNGSELAPAGAGGATTMSTSSSGTGGGLNNPTCDPPCQTPQFCSVEGQCIDEGTCLADGDCPFGGMCDPVTHLCSGCVPPNLLIVLDRSCSMTQDGGGMTKWEFAVAAIDQMTTTFAGQIRFGLTLFPDRVNPDCQQDQIPILVAPNTEPAIQTMLNAALVNSDPLFPDGPCVTNIDTAIEQAATQEPALDDPDRENYVLLLTDGRQAGCNAAGGDAGTTQIITDLLAMRGVATFVLGFGTGVDPVQMNIFANAGGVPTNDTTCMPPCNFYKAEDGASLQAALDSIAGQIGCDPDIN